VAHERVKPNYRDAQTTKHKIKKIKISGLAITIISHGIILLHSPVLLSKGLRSPMKPLIMTSGRKRNLPKQSSILFNNTETSTDALPTHALHILSRPIDHYQVSHLADLTATLINALRSYEPENKSTFS